MSYSRLLQKRGCRLHSSNTGTVGTRGQQRKRDQQRVEKSRLDKTGINQITAPYKRPNPYTRSQLAQTGKEDWASSGRTEAEGREADYTAPG